MTMLAGRASVRQAITTRKVVSSSLACCSQQFSAAHDVEFLDCQARARESLCWCSLANCQLQDHSSKKEERAVKTDKDKEASLVRVGGESDGRCCQSCRCTDQDGFGRNRSRPTVGLHFL